MLSLEEIFLDLVDIAKGVNCIVQIDLTSCPSGRGLLRDGSSISFTTEIHCIGWLFSMALVSIRIIIRGLLVIVESVLVRVLIMIFRAVIVVNGWESVSQVLFMG